MPKRIQMTRQRPWRNDNPDAVIVARPSKWGNPFQIGGHFINRGPWADAPYPHQGPAASRVARGGWRVAGERRPYIEIVAPVTSAAVAVELFRRHIAHENVVWSRGDICAELAGRDLACWCPLDQPCHGDVLLELANGAT